MRGVAGDAQALVDELLAVLKLAEDLGQVPIDHLAAIARSVIGDLVGDRLQRAAEELARLRRETARLLHPDPREPGERAAYQELHARANALLTRLESMLASASTAAP